MSSTFCILGVAVLWVAALPSPTLHREVSGDQTPSSTLRLRPNNSVVITRVRGHPTANRGAAGHMLPHSFALHLSNICYFHIGQLMSSLLRKKLIPKLRGWWVNGIDWRCANDLNVFTVSNDGKEGNWWILMNFNGDLSEVWLWGKGAQICLLISHLYRWSTQRALAHACVSSIQNGLL